MPEERTGLKCPALGPVGTALEGQGHAVLEPGRSMGSSRSLSLTTSNIGSGFTIYGYRMLSFSGNRSGATVHPTLRPSYKRFLDPICSVPSLCTVCLLVERPAEGIHSRAEGSRQSVLFASHQDASNGSRTERGDHHLAPRAECFDEYRIRRSPACTRNDGPSLGAAPGRAGLERGEQIQKKGSWVPSLIAISFSLPAPRARLARSLAEVENQTGIRAGRDRRLPTQRAT